MALRHYSLARRTDFYVRIVVDRAATLRITMMVASSIPQRGHEISRQMSGRQLIFHQVEHDIVQQCGDNFVALVEIHAHSLRLIAQKRRIQQKQLADGGFVPSMDRGEQSRGRRIPRRCERGPVVSAPGSVVAPLHRILPSFAVNVFARLP
jgi:hypothetical protein